MKFEQQVETKKRARNRFYDQNRNSNWPNEGRYRVLYCKDTYHLLMLVCLLMLLLICLLMCLILLWMNLFDILSGGVPPLCAGCGRICSSGWRHIQAIVVGTGICCGHRNGTGRLLKTASHFVRKTLLAGHIWIVTAWNVVVLLGLRCLLHDLMLLDLHLVLLQQLLLLVMLIDHLLMVHRLLVLCDATGWPPNGLFTRAPCTAMVLGHFLCLGGFVWVCGYNICSTLLSHTECGCVTANWLNANEIRKIQAGAKA